MKKIEFALQVFGLVAILPLYVILELNHASVSLPENKINTGITEKTEMINADIAGENEEQNIVFLLSAHYNNR